MRVKARKMFPAGLSLGLVLAGVSAVALWIHERPDTSRAFPTPAVHQAEDPAKRVTLEDIEALKAEIERKMKSELTSLRSQLTQMDRDQELIGQKINKLATTGLAPAGSEKADAPPLTPEEERERAEAQTRAQVEVLEGTTHAEKPDPAWANTAQLALNKMFQSEAMTGMQLVDADCRTTLCRLELIRDGSVSLEDSLRKLPRLAPWQGQGFFQIDGESAKVVVYLAREGYSLPQAGE